MRSVEIARVAFGIAVSLFLGVAHAAADEFDAKLGYDTYCTPCHGVAGNGKGINVVAMAVQPRDHTDTREMRTRSDQDLFNAIKNGGPAVGKSVLMPAWRAILSDEEIERMVEYLRELSDSEGAPVAVAAVAATPAPAPSSDRAQPIAVAAIDPGPLDVVAPPPPGAVKSSYAASVLHQFEVRVEEVEIDVAPGFSAKVWGFNGQVPGPLIRVREGDEVKVNFVNLTSMEHTIHWHGVHQLGSWQSDGVPNVSQQPVQPGGSFLYHFIATRPGTLWYHCHVNVAEHVGLRGMWGPLIVDPLEPTILEKEVTKDAILMFSGWSSASADRYGVGGHPGEVRDYYSINGKSFPLTQPLRVREGDVLRLRLFGAGTDLAFHLHGHDMLVTHKDGLPLASPYWADVIHIGEGERYDAIVRMNNPGIWMTHDHVDHHVTNAGKDMGGSMLIVEYEEIEKPSWYVWKDKHYDPNFYYSESLAAGSGLFDHPGFRGTDALSAK